MACYCFADVYTLHQHYIVSKTAPRFINVGSIFSKFTLLVYSYSQVCDVDSGSVLFLISLFIWTAYSTILGFINLGKKPVGISCEFCCGVGPIGITADGSSRCGCQHNPALLAITLGLMEYTDYSDAQVLMEVMKWKTLFFPKDMINLAMTVAGGDTSALDELPGMVGGC